MNSLTEWVLTQIAEIADVLTLDFVERFKPDIGYFNQIFPSAANYYQAFTITGFLLIVGIFSFSLLFLLGGIVTGYEESPPKMIGRAVIAFLLTAYSGNVMNEIYKIGYNIFDIFKSVGRSEGWSEGASILGFMGGDALGSVLKLVLGLVIVWNVLLVFLEIIERYLVMCLFWYLSPIVNATFVSSMSSRIFTTFYTSVFIQVLICSLNVWFMRMTIDVCLVASNQNLGASEALLQGLMIIAWLKVVRKIDDYLRAMGFGAVRTASSLGNSIVGTVMAVRSIAGIASGGKRMLSGGASQAFSQQMGFRDGRGKNHPTQGNKDISDAAFRSGGVMSEANSTKKGQDAHMATDQRGRSVATIIGEAAKITAVNSNIPGFDSLDVKKESLQAGGTEGERFKFSYETNDGSKVSGHISRVAEENGVKGIASVGASGEKNYTYFDKGSGLSTGTGIPMNQTTTIYDANNYTASVNENGEIKNETGAWNCVTVTQLGFEKAEATSHLTLEDRGMVRIDSADGKKMGVVLTSDHKQFEAAKSVGNYHYDPRNGNQMVGFPDSDLRNLPLEPENVMKFKEVQKIVGDDPIVKGNQTLATDGIQTYLSTGKDGRAVQHDFVTAENLNFNQIKEYKKVSLPNGGTIYHKASHPAMHNTEKTSRSQKKGSVKRGRK